MYKLSSTNMDMNSILGALAIVVAAVHVGSLSTMLSRAYPVQHVLGIMALHSALPIHIAH